MCLGLEMGQSCQVPLDSGSEHSGMFLPPLKAGNWPPLLPASLPWVCYLVPARASHIREKSEVGRYFYSCWRAKGQVFRKCWGSEMEPGELGGCFNLIPWLRRWG